MDNPTYAELASMKQPMPGPTAREEEPPASRAFRTLSNRIDELDASINDLVGRINPVLSPEMQPMPDGAEPEMPRSIITGMINEQDRRLQALIFLVNDTFRRVEV